MSDNAEYDDLVNKKENAQSQYRSCESRIEDCDYLLRRLRSSKEDIAELKEAFKENKKRDKNLRDEKREWCGSTYDDFCSKMSNLIETNDTYYKKTIDHILDSINDEITRVENKRLKEYGLLGQLGSWINSLTNEIENFFN